MNNWPLLAVAILFLILIPFAPALVRLKIGFLRGLGWNWAVSFAERHFDARVMLVRIILVAIAAVLLFVGWTQ